MSEIITNASLGLPDGQSLTAPTNPSVNVSGAVTTAQAVNYLIQYLMETANTQAGSAYFRVNDLVGYLNNSNYNLAYADPDSPTTVASTVQQIPSDVLASVRATVEEYKLNQGYAQNIIGALSNAWVEKFFPATVQGGIDTLLNSVSQALVSPAMQEIFWSRARDQVLRQAQAWDDEITNEWAGRGFQLPPGVLVNQKQLKSQEYNHKIAELAAQAAQEALKIQVDGIKFAADIAERLKTGLLNSMNAYIDANMRVLSGEMNHNVSSLQANTQLFNAINAYYDTLVRQADTDTRGVMSLAEQRARRESIVQQAWSEMIRSVTQTDLQSASVFSQIANSALGGLHGVATASVT